jgi:signal transduction histidine kinase
VRGSLLWRLLGAQLLVIVIAVAASGFAISQQAAQAFMAIMTRYHVDPATIAAEFQTSSRRIFVVSTLVAATIAMLLGWALMTRIVRPLKLMMMLAERIAQGDYARHVDVRGRDEIARLAESLNQMAASLHRIEGLRRDLVANVAHELRTPLTTLQGYLEALRDGVTPATPGTLEILHEEVLRLVRLVDDLHQLSQFDARVLRLRTGPLDLPMLVGRLVSVYRPEFARRGLDLIEAHDDGLPSVEADGDLVDRALRNLIDNALRYGRYRHRWGAPRRWGRAARGVQHRRGDRPGRRAAHLRTVLPRREVPIARDGRRGDRALDRPGDRPGARRRDGRPERRRPHLGVVSSSLGRRCAGLTRSSSTSMG